MPLGSAWIGVYHDGTGTKVQNVSARNKHERAARRTYCGRNGSFTICQIETYNLMGPVYKEFVDLFRRIFRKYSFKVFLKWFWCIILIGPIRYYGSDLFHLHKPTIHHQFHEFQGFVCLNFKFLCDLQHIWIISHGRNFQHIGVSQPNDIHFGNAELTVSGKLSDEEKGMVDFRTLSWVWSKTVLSVIAIFFLADPEKLVF